MKKIISIILASVLCIIMSVNVFAIDNINSAGGSANASVKGSYQEGSSADTVYSVDITWGSLEFTYTAASEGTWDPATHAYNGSAQGGWSCATNADVITVTNHSNADVYATLTYSPNSSYTGIIGSFTESSGIANDAILNLATALNTLPANAPTACATLALSGELDSSTAANTAIGTVTVTIHPMTA